VKTSQNQEVKKVVNEVGNQLINSVERVEFKRYYPEEYYKWTGTKLPESHSA
jgi:pyruvate-formate lyase-activating enzyme